MDASYDVPLFNPIKKTTAKKRIRYSCSAFKEAHTFVIVA
jgi:hypothetical protein